MTAPVASAARPRARRGIGSVDDVRARCVVDAVTRCWLWQGAKCRDGTPRVHTLDLARMDKRTMTGPQAMWQLAHGEPPPPGRLVYRACGCVACLNPAHMRLAASKAEIGQAIRRSGRWRGSHMQARRRNIERAWAATGVVPTPAEVVRALREAPTSVTNRALARQYGVSEQTVSKIRRGQARAGVV